MSGKPERYVLLFGFERGNDLNTGFLKVEKTGAAVEYSVVKDEAEATRFSEKDSTKALEFFSNEYELSNWKFHIVNRIVV